MAGMYNNWEAYFMVSYTRICFALPLSGLYCNISWSEYRESEQAASYMYK